MGGSGADDLQAGLLLQLSKSPEDVPVDFLEESLESKEPVSPVVHQGQEFLVPCLNPGKPALRRRPSDAGLKNASISSLNPSLTSWFARTGVIPRVRGVDPLSLLEGPKGLEERQVGIQRRLTEPIASMGPTAMIQDVGEVAVESQYKMHRISSGGLVRKRFGTGFEGLFVDLEVAIHHPFPGVVEGHSVRDGVPPGCWFLISGYGPFDQPVETFRLVVVEEKAGVTVLDGVVQATHPAGQGDGAISHGPHLCQAAGFVEGGHQEGVGSGDDAMLLFLHEPEIDSHPVRVGGCKILQSLFVPTFATPQEDELGVGLPDGGSSEDQIQALLCCHSGDHADQEFVRVLLEAVFPLNGCLAHAFSVEVDGGVVRRKSEGPSPGSRFRSRFRSGRPPGGRGGPGKCDVARTLRPPSSTRNYGWG